MADDWIMMAVDVGVHSIEPLEHRPYECGKCLGEWHA